VSIAGEWPSDGIRGAKMCVHRIEGKEEVTYLQYIGTTVYLKAPHLF
jgi:hypothetical protein